MGWFRRSPQQTEVEQIANPLFGAIADTKQQELQDNQLRSPAGLEQSTSKAHVAREVVPVVAAGPRRTTLQQPWSCRQTTHQAAATTRTGWRTTAVWRHQARSDPTAHLAPCMSLLVISNPRPAHPSRSIARSLLLVHSMSPPAQARPSRPTALAVLAAESVGRTTQARGLAAALAAGVQSAHAVPLLQEKLHTRSSSPGAGRRLLCSGMCSSSFSSSSSAAASRTVLSRLLRALLTKMICLPTCAHVWTTCRQQRSWREQSLT